VGGSLMRADEHLKNVKGFLGQTPLVAVSGWKLQYEQNAEKGMTVYFTPIKSGNERADAADCGGLESCGEAVPIDGPFLPAFSGRSRFAGKSEVDAAMSTSAAVLRAGGPRKPGVSTWENLRGLWPYLGRYTERSRWAWWRWRSWG